MFQSLALTLQCAALEKDGSSMNHQRVSLIFSALVVAVVSMSCLPLIAAEPDKEGTGWLA
jgi:hypothetical protein